jgi:hypothetical protein
VAAAGDAGQFRASAQAFGLPIAAHNNAWRARLRDVATQLIFGGSQELRAVPND